MQNPLIDYPGLPPFGRIEVSHIEPAVDQVLDENRCAIAKLLEDPEHYSWKDTLRPIEDINDRLNRLWSPVGHLHNVADNDELRSAYKACLPKLADYATELTQNADLYKAYQFVANSDEWSKLGVAEHKIIENALRDFRLSGIELSAPEKARFKQIKQELSQLQAKFDENLLDATHAWKKHLTDESLLAGLPDSARVLAAQNAKRESAPGWVFTLEVPSYMPVMRYADERDIRFEMYRAYSTRASDCGPMAGKWDNTEIMSRILALRHELARLIGYANYAEYSLATKMAKDPQEVLSFLRDLAQRSRPVAERELSELRSFSMQRFGMQALEAWDIPYYSEKLRRHRFAISQEELRPYFPMPRVLQGLFEVASRLYGVEICEFDEVDTWHPDVRFYDIYDRSGSLRGRFYLDLYARPHKRGGAWMDECIVRRRIVSGGVQVPVAYLSCNVTPPLGDDPALITHEEVITLFHEFGHGLHHMLTLVDYPSVAGINGVAWDAVELPSQFMENWCWEREALALISGHYRTGEAISGAQYERMLAAKNFQSAMQMVRQLEFALFDLRLHMLDKPPQGAEIQALLSEIRDEVAVLDVPAFNRFQNGFSHIFSGGYAAGYYSYKWAEVLSSDAFSKFEQHGIFDRTTGDEFLHCVLEQGGSLDAMDLFIQFRGREPSIEPLLRHSGISA